MDRVLEVEIEKTYKPSADPRILPGEGATDHSRGATRAPAASASPFLEGGSGRTVPGLLQPPGAV